MPDVLAIMSDVTANNIHDVVKSTTFGKLMVKCVECGSRKKWPWKRMVKCRHCKKLWHLKCAPSEATTVQIAAIVGADRSAILETDLSPVTVLPVSTELDDRVRRCRRMVTDLELRIQQDRERFLCFDFSRVDEGSRDRHTGEMPTEVVAELSEENSFRPKDVVRAPSFNDPRATFGLVQTQKKTSETGHVELGQTLSTVIPMDESEENSPPVKIVPRSRHRHRRNKATALRPSPLKVGTIIVEISCIYEVSRRQDTGDKHVVFGAKPENNRLHTGRNERVQSWSTVLSTGGPEANSIIPNTQRRRRRDISWQSRTSPQNLGSIVADSPRYGVLGRFCANDTASGTLTKCPPEAESSTIAGDRSSSTDLHETQLELSDMTKLYRDGVCKEDTLTCEQFSIFCFFVCFYIIKIYTWIVIIIRPWWYCYSISMTNSTVRC